MHNAEKDFNRIAIDNGPNIQPDLLRYFLELYKPIDDNKLQTCVMISNTQFQNTQI